MNTKQLTEEIAAPTITGVRNPFAESAAWGLTPDLLIQHISQACRNESERYLALAAEMERRDGHYYSKLQMRKAAVILRERSIVPGRKTPSKIVEELETFIQSEVLGSALFDIMDALAKNYSLSEIIWESSEGQWVPKAIKYVDPRFLKFDDDTMSKIELVQNDGSYTPLLPMKFIEHRPKVFSGVPLAGGLARIVCAYHLYKSYALKDWMVFAEVFGMPIRMGKYPSGAKPEEVQALREAVTAIGSDAAAVIPQTMAIEFERATQSGFAGSDNFFQMLADWQDSQVSKAVTGENISDQGGSYAKAKTLDGVRLDICKSDCYQLANTLNECLIRPYYDLNYGPPKGRDYPRLAIECVEPEDLTAFATALTPFVGLGLRVGVKEVYERFGLSEPAEGEEILRAPARPDPSQNGGEPPNDKKKPGDRQKPGDTKKEDKSSAKK